MGLSDSEIAARLAALRRQREALDREIADLVLYQELGRRLAAGGADARPDPTLKPDPPAGLRRDPADGPPRGRDVPEGRPGAPADGEPAARGRRGVRVDPAARSAGAPDPAGAAGPIPPVIAFTEDAAGARRYGRAVVQAACAAIARAGRPLHAAEILEVLARQGFTLPGRDPVAALNTRLWKRSGPGGPLNRVAEATYALASSEPDPARGVPVTKT
ncbi:hypothetical protein ABID82_006432 [Methylobacterium sp. PvP062]|uniref:HTH HARE-type domain-containing protein n=2 Tax=Methylobacterium radiotolerans TaxID=31998 RepID=B1M5G1_METRJ|nr:MULTISPECIES: hypothetical protein [Methylobacterium]MCX7330943.1 hypothetical protein [Hyphomicrobiales bacterium]ACB23552.1 conserved hypothetical protein [Methylobacterium radiotolerans JCM 2831]MBP2494167.1 hypothetical protein [Methylobacterium sp. PvP105]MBP2499459.1 hypothetical protein [Methylobacterium sp. PvP109]GEN01387.1 hypothetical protein MRA01_59260 [Methylobacterium radiotolerans]